MSEQTQATITLPAGLRRQPAVKEPSTREGIPRLARLLALAHRWETMIHDGSVFSQAEIAEMTGLSKPSISQIMALRWLCPVLQAALMEGSTSSALVGTKRWWRATAIVDWEAQFSAGDFSSPA